MTCYNWSKISSVMSNLTPGWQKTSVLESVFDQLSDALVLYDAEYRITGVNRAAERLFGMSGEEMLGKHCQQIFQCSVCEPNCGVLVGLNQTPSNANTTVRLHTGNGMERLVVMRTNQMFDSDGQLSGVVATIKAPDVSVVARQLPPRSPKRPVKAVQRSGLAPSTSSRL